MNFPVRLTQKNILLLGGAILIWLFPVISIFVSFGERDVVTGLVALLVGIISSILLYILIIIVNKILPKGT
ncbi:MAG: hypothetical protein ACW964_10510 [Candidatus Hodarchaeales archaeon]|jgi:hypothetical protein